MEFNKEQKKEVCELLDKCFNGAYGRSDATILEQFKRDNDLLDDPLEVGAWYKDDNAEYNRKFFIESFTESGDATGYGIGNLGNYYTSDDKIDWGVVEYDLIKMTHQEVKDALIKEWEKDNEGFERYALTDSSNHLTGWNGIKKSQTLFDNGTWFPIESNLEKAKRCDSWNGAITEEVLPHEVIEPSVAEMTHIMWEEFKNKKI